ncbi:MAG: AsmA family protein [Pseudomonadota bacterium]
MRWLKYIVISLTSLLIVSVTMIITLAFLLDQDQFRDVLVYTIDRTTGHQLEINGPLELDLSLSPSINVSDIYFKTAAEDFELSAAEIYIQVDILSLRSNFVIVREILIKDSIANIRETPDDDSDWLFAPSGIRVPFIEKLNIENLDFNYWQLAEAEPLRINLDSLKKDDKTGTELILIKGSGKIDGAAFKLEGESAAVSTLLTSDLPFPFNYHFEVMQAVIHAEGEISNPHEAGDLDISVQVEAPDVQGILKLLHASAPDIGRLALTGRLTGTIDAPQLDDIEFNVSKDKVAVQVSGHVGNLLAAEDINLDFSTAISDAKLLAWLLPDESLRFSNIQSSGKLSGSADTLSLSEFTLDASDPRGQRLEINGSTRIVDAPLPLRDLDATLSISSPDTGYLLQFVDNMPVIGPVTGAARVSTDTNALVIEDIKLTAGNKQKVLIEAQGNIRHIVLTPNVDVSKMDLNIDITGTTARRIGELINARLPDFGPVSMSGHYSGSITNSIVRNIHVQAGRPEQLEIEARGEIKLAALDGDEPLAGLDLDITFEAPSTTSLTAIAGTRIPAMGRLKGSAHISDPSGIPAITALDINVQKGSDFRVTLNGGLADLENMNGLDLKLDLLATDMNVMGQFFDQSLPEEGAVRLSGIIKGSLDKTRFTGQTNLRNTVIDTDLTGAFTGKRPHLAGSITIPDLDVHDFGYYPDRQVEKTSKPANEDNEWYAGKYEDKKEKTVRTEPLFSKEPLNLSGLGAIDLDLEIQVNEFSSTAASLDRIDGHVFLDNGKLDVKSVKLLVAGDEINVSGTINSSAKPPEVSLLVSGDGIDLGLLLENPATKKSPIRGLMTARADTHSRGQSFAELAANLDGQLYIVTENAKVRKSYLNLVNVDVLGFVISNIVSLNKDANIGCAIFSMGFNKGIGATDLFIMDTPGTLIRIDADINLVNETMDIAILPEHKVRLFKKTKPMKIYGPITNPTYEVVSLVDLTREATRSYLLLPLTITTGLLDNIIGLIVKPDEPKGSCDKFLE